MSVQSSGGELQQLSHPDGARIGQTERTFVVQFDPVEGARSRLRGRIEQVASGEAIRFRSLKELVGFLADQLRRRAKGER